MPKSLKDNLARFMDPGAFVESVSEPLKRLSPTTAKARADKLRVRREIAKQRADAAIRFFAKPGNRERLERSIEARERA